jgi:hypothetical protein
MCQQHQAHWHVPSRPLPDAGTTPQQHCCSLLTSITHKMEPLTASGQPAALACQRQPAVASQQVPQPAAASLHPQSPAALHCDLPAAATLMLLCKSALQALGWVQRLALVRCTGLVQLRCMRLLLRLLAAACRLPLRVSASVMAVSRYASVCI